MELSQVLAHEVGRRTHPSLVEALPGAVQRRNARIGWVNELRHRLGR